VPDIENTYESSESFQ